MVDATATVEETKAPEYRRPRNSRLRFDPNDDLVWNKSIEVDGVMVAIGSAVDKTKIPPARLRRMFALSWVVSAKHPRLLKREA